jgi:hypothetical protein
MNEWYLALLLAVTCLFGMITLVVGFLTPAPVPQALQEAASQLKLRREGDTFEGTLGGVLVQAHITKGKNRAIELRGPTSQRQAKWQIQGGPASLPTGDALFDQKVWVGLWAGAADEAELLALADPELRKKLVKAVQMGLELSSGTWHKRLSVYVSTQDLVAALLALAQVHLALEEAAARDVHSALPARLQDPSAGVRRRALALLVERGWAKAEVLEPLLKDLDPEVRLGAAVASREGEVLLQMVAKGSRTWRIKAAQALLQHTFPLDEGGRAIVEDAALDLLGDEELSGAAAEILGVVGSPSALAELARHQQRVS